MAWHERALLLLIQFPQMGSYLLGSRAYKRVRLAGYLSSSYAGWDKGSPTERVAKEAHSAKEDLFEDGNHRTATLRISKKLADHR